MIIFSTTPRSLLHLLRDAAAFTPPLGHLLGVFQLRFWTPLAPCWLQCASNLDLVAHLGRRGRPSWSVVVVGCRRRSFVVGRRQSSSSSPSSYFAKVSCMKLLIRSRRRRRRRRRCRRRPSSSVVVVFAIVVVLFRRRSRKCHA